ncbi:MAG: universal stress protein [Calditrichaeota bacterium]|nr:MAG: universal stress protein [Calditrichota bacterium]MBL1204626.1 universal stress protein [Calditrichota bacterium]NOG44455.1 universal stress protein [Calditrichota bacterium]
MIKSILIPLDPSPYTDSAIEVGCRMAKYHGAQLTGLVILDIPGIEKQIGPVPIGGSYYADKLEEKHTRHAQERIDQLLHKFRSKCDAAGVKHVESQNQGSPSERILHESLFYDMVITGLRTHFHFETQDKPGSSLHELLHESITPIYGVPKDLMIPDPISDKIKVLIPFNGSLPAARALQRFAQFMIPEMSEPRLLISEDDEHVASSLLKSAKDYLELHGFKNIITDWTTDKIIESCKGDMLDWADVVVVGAHSKRGLFDFMVGSLTEHLIKWDKKPILIGQ